MNVWREIMDAPCDMQTGVKYFVGLCFLRDMLTEYIATLHSMRCDDTFEG